MFHAVTSSVLSFSISLSTHSLHCRCVFIGPNIFKNELCKMNILYYGLYFLNVSNLLVDDQKIYFLNQVYYFINFSTFYPLVSLSQLQRTNQNQASAVVKNFVQYFPFPFLYLIEIVYA